MCELTGQQIAALREGLQKGFPGAMPLTMFLMEQLDKPLAYYAGHPQGAVLKLSIGDHRGSNGAGNRFRYDVNTQKGSSGSPVFNAHLELIGMHNSGWADAAELAADHNKANQGIPISNIAALLGANGIALPTAGT